MTKKIKTIKLSIKDIMCDLKMIDDVLYISDTDINRVLNKQKKTRGRQLSKNKLADLETPYVLPDQPYYPLEDKYVDECYHNLTQVTEKM